MMNKILVPAVAGLLAGAAVAAPFSEADLETARQLREQALQDRSAYEITADLTTRIGNRLAGSANDAKAVAWAVEQLESLGFDRVWTEPATFPSWTREHEQVEITHPVSQSLVALAIGFSPSTPEGGIEAEVVMFEDLAALEAATDEAVAGRIVYISKRMERARDGSGYGATVAARSQGSMVAAAKGAKALVIRSVGTSTNRFAHTGTMRFDAGSRRIPAAAISNPDADQVERLIALGETLRMKVDIGAQINQTYTSQNVMAEVTGGRLKDQYVALGAHLDSWDVGTGAIDDGAGVGIVTAAAKMILDHDRRPDRSIRVILFAAEEIGLWGGRAFAQAHKDQVENIQLGAESDFGAGPVYRISANVAEQARPVIEAIHAELEPLGIALGEGPARGGPDFSPMAPYGMAAVDLSQDGSRYFDYHHTENDTFDKIDPEEMSQNVAAYVVLAWLAAQSPVDFGSGPGLLEAQADD
ncbi:MAG: M20/M25/M40 family metallo-hydrolase [Wenzhouxiangellaceae bacterium]|nr:M20/M25/M40 family metallo-hydrolase [Wenzhouxiangellaceae bacterium]